MATAVLSLDSITKRYKNVTAVDNVTANMYEGEIIGLVGINGAGKSTLIKLIGGLVMPDSGDIQVCGTSMYRDFEKCMTSVGVVPEHPAFYSHLSGRKNLRVLASMYKGVGEDVINELANELELNGYLDAKVSTYPEGVRARLAVAAGLLNSPTVLVMDEILAGLDPMSVLNVRRFLRGLAANHGVCVLISANHMTEVERVCDKVAVMDHGRLLGISSIELIKQANCNTGRHRMLIDRPDEAAVYLNENEGVGIEVHESYIIVEADQANIPRYLSMLGSRGFLVYEVAPVETTLENAYIRMLKKRPPQNA